MYTRLLYHTKMSCCDYGTPSGASDVKLNDSTKKRGLSTKFTLDYGFRIRTQSEVLKYLNCRVITNCSSNVKS